jgi:amino acid adenylation domain-containing protein
LPEPECPELECSLPETDLLSDWLRRSAAATPDAAAIVEDDRVTTFRELFEQSRSLAARFVEHGVKRQDRIALVMPKTTEAIISIFASLLAGAIYVPIHPQWPKERVEAALADCGARLVIEGDGSPPRIIDSRINDPRISDPRITDRATGGSIPWQAATVTPIATVVDGNSLPRANAADPAVILFTSGSTGQPKGVVLSHRAVSAFVKWSAREFKIGATDRIACPSPLSFDLSTFDIFNMALRGATCVLVPGHIAWMPRFLVQFLREARITCWYSVPSILAGMLEEGRMAQREYPGLRVILFAGEVFHSTNVARLQAAVPQAVCANLYGPTETNVVTWCGVPRGFDGSQPLPIGLPCPYAKVTVDAASGELLAGGESLMSGYWNRPEDTQRAFVSLEGERYYRTGDRVSRAADGNYLFAGRLDRQVKRRGFRIELGEIETALRGLKDILEAAAVAVDDGKGDGEMGTVVTIVAFVRPRAVGAVSLIEAKAHCARALPLYMVPDRIVFLDAMPKGNRGKIDYQTLGKIAEALDHTALNQAAPNHAESKHAEPKLH